jgi:CTP:molybdopterin cytidylyltransferase MocA
MPALTPDAVRTATETLTRLTEHLRENPDPDEALALVEPLLDEYTGIPVQLGDTLRALARAVAGHPDTPRTPALHLLVSELRTAAWEQTDQHALHYTVDGLRALLANGCPGADGCPRTPECCRCR